MAEDAEEIEGPRRFGDAVILGHPEGWVLLCRTLAARPLTTRFDLDNREVRP